MVSKVDILDKHYQDFDVESGWIFDGDVQNVFNAMDEYAKEIAIGFFKWYATRLLNFLHYIKDIRPLVESQELEEKIKEHEGQSIEQLFQSYLNSLK